jgi:acyl-coenzyme A synthetase/AMP-(fatty) acid ligase
MTAALANHLRSRGVRRGSLVPICFEKSMWTIIAMLAVMKPGLHLCHLARTILSVDGSSS